MLQRLIATRLVSSPAIWGKLPGHADFVRSGMRHQETEGWRSWLAEHAGMPDAGATPTLPAAFVLPPGTLGFAPRHFVLGVITPSLDRVGRRHVLVVYQRAHPRWVRRHFEIQARHPYDWLFWLARAVACHAGPRGTGELQALERSVHALWRLHGPSWRDLGWCLGSDGSTSAHAQALLDRSAEAAGVDDPAQDLCGVHYLPWVDWPDRLHPPCAQSAFWQQDAAGGFVNAANRLTDIWSSES